MPVLGDLHRILDFLCLHEDEIQIDVPIQEAEDVTEIGEIQDESIPEIVQSGFET